MYGKLNAEHISLSVSYIPAKFFNNLQFEREMYTEMSNVKNSIWPIQTIDPDL